MIIVMMGVSGAGKSTVGRQLADLMQCEFHEGDDYHTPDGRRKMSAGVALTDEDREPWLSAIRALMVEIEERQGCAVIACSALKERYRDRLRLPGVRFVYLKVPRSELLERLKNRRDHFAGPELLESQLRAFEEPQDAIVVDGTKRPEEVVQEVESRIEREGMTHH
jgi:gluconokinase